MSTLKNISLVCCSIVAIASLGWQLMHDTHANTYEMDIKALAKTPDALIYNLRYQQYDTAGQLIHFLESPLIQHIPKRNLHILTTPHIIVMEPGKEPWIIDADSATSIDGGKQIDFNQHVLISQNKQDTNYGTRLSTQALTYFPEQKRAKTTAEITITQAGNQLQSKGMIADLNENRIRLLSNARGHYVQSTS